MLNKFEESYINMISYYYFLYQTNIQVIYYKGNSIFNLNRTDIYLNNHKTKKLQQNTTVRQYSVNSIRYHYNYSKITLTKQ